LLTYEIMKGGAIKVSKKYLTLIKPYVKNGDVYVLVNNGTMSQGEIFTLQLKQLDNVKVLGQTTNGTLMYGSNYGKTEKLPSKAFQIYITDMDGDKRLLPYEVFGVNPDITLSNISDWVEQTVEIIRKK
jgi:C-terminal processing protease CtpA/Prc